jgi:circadian clock protein KaiB
MNTVRLKLYIAGQTPRSESAVARVRHLFETMLRAPYEMVVIDVLERPGLADEDKVIATPTLIKLVPPPSRRVVGDLSDLDQVARWLGVDPVGADELIDDDAAPAGAAADAAAASPPAPAPTPPADARVGSGSETSE